MGKRFKSASEKKELLKRRFAFIGGKSLCSFQNGRGDSPFLIIMRDCITEVLQTLYLGDDIESLAGVKLDIYIASGFETRTKFRLSTANSFCNGTNPSMLATKECDNAISLAQFLGSYYDRLISIQRHGYTVVKMTIEVRD